MLFLFTGVRGLKSVWLKAPVAVTPGQSATLQCNYDLEGEELYTVKWYKGREEFFRYVPKEHPHTRIFPLPGVNVDVSNFSFFNFFLLLNRNLKLGKPNCSGYISRLFSESIRCIQDR